jgi:hypothetical protein
VAADLLPFLLLGILILALLIGWPIIKRRSDRGAGMAGRSRGRRFLDAKRAEALATLGSTLVVHAPEPVAREIIAAAVAKQEQHFTVRSDGGYGIRFVEPDDTIVRLVRVPDGTRMQVETFREYLDGPRTVPLWEDLRSRVTSAAAARRIPVSTGEQGGFRQEGLIDGRDARWAREDGTSSGPGPGR